MADNLKKESNYKTDHRNHMLSKERKAAEKNTWTAHTGAAGARWEGSPDVFMTAQ